MLSHLSCPYCHNTFEYEFCICTRKNSQSKHSIEYIQCTLLSLDNLEYKYRNRRWKLYGHKPWSYLRTKCKGNLGVQKYKSTLPAVGYNPLKCASAECAERNISKTLTHQTTGRTRVTTGTCFIQKIYAPSSYLLQGKHLPFSPSPLRFNMFRLFVFLSLNKLYRYTLSDCHI